MNSEPNRSEQGEFFGRGDSASAPRTPSRGETARRVALVLVHTLALGVVLASLRHDKLRMLTESAAQPLTSIQVLAVLGPELGVLAFGQACWALLARSRRWGSGRRWPVAYLLVHLPGLLLVAFGHRYYLATLHVLDWQGVRYALSELSVLSGVLAEGVDRQLYITLALVVCCPLLGLVWWCKGRPPNWADRVGVPWVLGATGGLLALVPSVGEPKVDQLSGSLLSELFPMRDLRFAERPIPSRRLYRAPQLVPQSARRSSPNVLLVILESTRRDLLQAYGAPQSAMPFVDALAKNAVVVDNAYIGVSHTSKALVTMLCGMYPRGSMPIAEAEPGGLPLHCLPKLLAAAGYQTAFFQPAGNFEKRLGLTENMGFARRFVPSKEDGQGHPRSGYLGYGEPVMSEPAARWIEETTGPFFATVLTLATHHPYLMPGRQSGIGGDPKRLYRQSATYVDRFLEKLFERLRRAGKLDNTLVIVTADHGEGFEEHVGFRQHDAVPYEEVTHVPMFLVGEQWVGKARRLGGLRHHLDLMPTILDLVGVSVEGKLPGEHLLHTGGHPFVVTACWTAYACRTLRHNNLAYVFHYGMFPLQVFDVQRDPFQRIDLAQDVAEVDRLEAVDFMLGTELSVSRYYQTVDTVAARRDPVRSN